MRAHLAIPRRQAEQRRPGAVVRRVEDFVVVEDRRGDVGGVVRDRLKPPHQPAVRCADADAGARRQRHDDSHALDVGSDRRGIAGFVAQLLAGPHRLAGYLVERDDSGTRTAGRDDDVVAVDERRFADQPRNLAAAEVAQDIALPQRRAVLGLEARERPLLRQDVHAIVVDRRRAARTRPAIVGSSRPERLRPDPFPIGAIERVDHALPVFRALHENAIALGRDRAVAGAERRDRPNDRRTCRGPVLQ